MQHGGPFPATTDSRFTSVGADGIKRFARPLAFQNWPNELLPDELKDENPLKIWRTVNAEITPPSYKNYFIDTESFFSDLNSINTNHTVTRVEIINQAVIG